MSKLDDIPRGEKPGIAQGIQQRLEERKAKGPPEPGLDPYIDELKSITVQLQTHVTGKTTADAARTALNDLVGAASVRVGTRMRHIAFFLEVEARNHRSPHAPGARALYDAAFPQGLGPLDDYAINMNVYCRATSTALRAPAHQDTLTAIDLPPPWLDDLEAALKESEAAMDQLLMARGDKSAHIGLGRDAEGAWVDLMVRLRRQVASRAKRGDTAKQVENKQLLEPLLVALQKLDAEAAARATRRKGKQETPAQLAQPAQAAQPAQPVQAVEGSGGVTPPQKPAVSTDAPPSQRA